MKKTKNNKLLLIALCVLILISVSLILYPIFASIYNEHHLSIVSSDYYETIKKTDVMLIEKVRYTANKYNKGLLDGTINGLDVQSSGYNDQLNFAGGIMGYIRIPSIDVNLPIYHGVSSHVMTIGAGHMSNTSLPVGGASTHCVISSHSGLASRRGFTDIVDLQVGDIFYVDVLNETHTYKINSIQTVLPYEIDTIKIRENEDLFSLVTCVPFGVNTHRLVVTGSRQLDAEMDAESNSTDTVSNDKANQPNTVSDKLDLQEKPQILRQSSTHSTWTSQYFFAIILGLCIAVVIILLVVIFRKLYKRFKSK